MLLFFWFASEPSINSFWQLARVLHNNACKLGRILSLERTLFMPIENRKYKDTVFRMLFNNKMHLLELYNAINGTNYKNPEDLEITTLAGETFLKMKNRIFKFMEII